MVEKDQKKDNIEYVVGEELNLKEMLFTADVKPLLNALVKAGASYAIIANNSGEALMAQGNLKGFANLPADIMDSLKARRFAGEQWQAALLVHEGEPVGYIFISIPPDCEDLSLVLEIVSSALRIVIRNTAKRMLTTDLHSTIVKRSYEELVEMNQNLAVSERRYRELAATLEQKVQERTSALKQAHIKLIQQEKMASLGQLAAGLAHEINNPIGFIASNLNTLERYINSIKEIMQIYRAKSHGDKEAEEAYRKMKIDFKLQDIAELIEQSRSGADRIRRIIENLKGFSHIDEAEMRDVDFKEEIERTLNVLSHEIALRSAQVISRFGDIPKYYCSAGLIGQVFVNLIMNALQSRERDVTITITTLEKDGNIIISIADNGVGMSEAIKNRIFEPFFTTKDVNKGSGMGLTVAYDIVSSIGGTIEVQSQPGKGSVFTITLPLKGGLNV